MNDQYIAEDVEAPLSYTGKSARGSLFTLRANDAAQFVDRSTDAIESNVFEWVGKLDDELASKTGAAPSAGGARSSGSSSPRSGRPSTQGRPTGGAPRGAAPQTQQNDDVEYHPEGLLCGAPGCNEPVYLKSGTSKAGRQYSLWTCPNQRSKGDGHHSEYI